MEIYYGRTLTLVKSRDGILRNIVLYLMLRLSFVNDGILEDNCGGTTRVGRLATG